MNKTQFDNLKPGDSGPGVTELRAYLRTYGYLPAGAEGSTFDSKLSDAVRAFQHFHGFDEQGRVSQELATYMLLPRCGAPDVANCAGTWSSRMLTYRIHDAPTRWEDKQKQPNTAIAWAFGAWREASTLTFTEATPPAAADINVQFFKGEHGDCCKFDGMGGVHAHAFCPDEPKPWTGAIHFDDEEAWASDVPTNGGARSLKVLSLHEIGHALGLSHSRSMCSIMHPCYPVMIARSNPYTLDHADVAAINGLYP